jgi:hypothetical protein
MNPDKRDAAFSKESQDFYAAVARKASLACQVTLAGFEADDAGLLLAVSSLWSEVASLAAAASGKAADAALYAKNGQLT